MNNNLNQLIEHVEELSKFCKAQLELNHDDPIGSSYLKGKKYAYDNIVSIAKEDFQEENLFTVEAITSDNYVLKFKNNAIAFFDNKLNFFLMTRDVKDSFLKEFRDGNNICA